MTNKIILKIKSNSGESIAETLVAVLIAAVGLLMLAGTINAASNLITKSQNTLNRYYEANNKVESRDSSVKVKVSAVASFSVIKDQSLAIDPEDVTLYENDTLSKHVIAYELIQKTTEAKTGDAEDVYEGYGNDCKVSDFFRRGIIDDN